MNKDYKKAFLARYHRRRNLLEELQLTVWDHYFMTVMTMLGQIECYLPTKLVVETAAQRADEMLAERNKRK